jgi:hypothetical protein
MPQISDGIAGQKNCPGQPPDDHQGAVEEHVGEQVRAEVPLLPQTDGCLLAEPRLTGGRPQVGHGCHLLHVTVPPPAADRMSQRDLVRQAEGPGRTQYNGANNTGRKYEASRMTPCRTARTCAARSGPGQRRRTGWDARVLM